MILRFWIIYFFLKNYYLKTFVQIQYYKKLFSGEWKNQTFKKYNFNTQGVPISCGHLHPLLKVREEFRNIFFEMG